MNDDEVDEIFSMHKREIPKITKCVFNKENILKNKEILEKFENEGLIRKNDFYDEEDENKAQKKKDDYFTKVNKDYKENWEIYCGYLDKIDSINLNKSKREFPKEISCSYCFSLFTVYVSEEGNQKFLITSKKPKNVFIDYCEKISKENLLREIGNMPLNDENFVIIKCNNCSNIIGYGGESGSEYVIHNFIK